MRRISDQGLRLGIIEGVAPNGIIENGGLAWGHAMLYLLKNTLDVSRDKSGAFQIPNFPALQL